MPCSAEPKLDIGTLSNDPEGVFNKLCYGLYECRTFAIVPTVRPLSELKLNEGWLHFDGGVQVAR